MDILLVTAGILVLGALAHWFGADSRDSTDHDWEVPWDRLPR